MDTASSPHASPIGFYQEQLDQGRLAYQFDRLCGRVVFPPRVIAPGTGSVDLEWRHSSGLGTVHAVTVIRPRGEPAYNVVLVDLDEGFRLMSRVEDLPPEQVGIGLRVRLRVHRPEDGTAPYPVFVQEAA